MNDQNNVFLAVRVIKTANGGAFPIPLAPFSDAQIAEDKIREENNKIHGLVEHGTVNLGGKAVIPLKTFLAQLGISGIGSYVAETEVLGLIESARHGIVTP